MPTTSRRRRLARASVRTLQVVVYTLLFSAVVFFGLTRTEVGRGELRQQIESQFNERFAGTLQIGALRGNLVNDLYASDVYVLDPDGRTLVAVDSVVARPRWTSLLGGTLSIRSLTLHRPQVGLHRDSTGRWNAATAFQQTTPSSGNKPVDVTLTDVHVRDGSVATFNHGDTPQAVRENWVFDYTETRVEHLNARATVEWSDEDRLAEVYDVSLSLPSARLQVADLNAQVVQTADGWALNQVEVVTERSRLTGSGSVRPVRSDDAAGAPDVDLRLDPSRLDNSELRGVLPRLPRSGTTRLHGHVYGTPSRLVVEEVDLAYGRSQVRLSGTVFGLPDSLDVEARVDDARLRVADLRSIFQSAGLSTNRLEAVAAVRELSVDGFVEGSAQWRGLRRPVYRFRSSLEAASPVGAVAGSLSVKRDRGRLPQYTASLDTDSLNLAPVLRRPVLRSRLNGRVWVNGRGFRPDSTLQADVDVQLRASDFAGQRLDTLSVTGDVDGRTLRATVDVTQPGGGRFRGRGQLDATGSTPVYRFALASLRFDLGRWPVDLPHTRLNGIATLQGRGTTWDELAGTVSVRVDTSLIMRGDSTTVLPPHWSTVHLAERGSSQPRIDAYGSVGSLKLTGEVPARPLVELGRLWATALRDAARREVQKPYQRTNTTTSAAVRPPERPVPSSPALASRSAPLDLPLTSGLASDPPSPLDDPVADSLGSRRSEPVNLDPLRERARTALTEAGYDGPLRLAGSIQVDQPEVVRAWWPRGPRFDDAISGRSDLVVGPDTLAVEGSFEAATLRAASPADGADAPADTSAVASTPPSVVGLRLTLQSNASLNAPLAETLTGRVDVSADTVRARGRTLALPRLSAEYARRQGLLRLTAGPDSSGQSAALPADSGQADTTRGLTVTKAPPVGAREGTAGPPFQLTAELDVQATRNVLTIRHLYASTGRLTWQNTQPGRIDLYADAAVIDSFAVESPRTSASGNQRIQFHGTLSNTASDTVFVETSDVLVYPVLAALGAKRRPVGGLVNGRVSVTGGLTSPSVGADFTVARLSFDRRLLGRLQLSARYATGSPDVRVAADLSPETLPLDSLRSQYATLVPGGLTTAEKSTLSLSGTVTVPALAGGPKPASDTSGTASPGLLSTGGPGLDLRLDVDRADLFFFEYIFEDDLDAVRGYTAGSGTITGTFFDPTFNADMIVREGRFSLPQFGLRYGIEGSVKVDREGFHLRDVLVSDGDGTAELEGGVLFNEYRYFSFDLRGELDEIEIINVSESQELPFYGNIRASATATLTGPLYNARLTSEAARTTPESELFIPVSEEDVDADSGYIIFADSTGRLPDIRDLTRRDNILSDRPAGEPTFIDGMEIDINVIAPEGSTVHLVFDPLVGDVVTAVGSGRVQLQQQEGEFLTYGQFNVSGGDYLFTAGEVFVRRFTIGDGTITWDGDPINAKLDIDAAYRTRASTRGLPGETESTGRIPVVINLDITGRVETPQVDLGLSLARDDRGQLVGTRTLDAILNQPDATTEYATSVLLTNTFLLTTGSANQSGSGSPGGENRLASAGNQLAFNSVSQLVASQLNRYLSAALPNVDVNFGLQGETPEDLDVIYGVALRLLDERLIIRGEGVYTGDDPSDARTAQSSGPQGEFVVEVRLSRRVSAEVFFRRQGDDVAREALTQTAGAGVSYQSEFSTWRQLYIRLFGWLGAGPDDPEPAPPDTTDAIATGPPRDDGGGSGDEDAPPTGRDGAGDDTDGVDGGREQNR